MGGLYEEAVPLGERDSGLLLRLGCVPSAHFRAAGDKRAHSRAHHF